MDEQLVPKLEQISVAANKLLLDPNNPRFITGHDEKIAEEDLADPSVITATHEKMLYGNLGRENDKDSYRIRELMHSIEQNGWQAVDSIFVRPYTNGLYVVLEGNRRVTAVTELLKKDDLSPDLKESIKKLEVMEVKGVSNSEQFEHQISYLLGVRHHGSLKKWSPFAQSRNIFSVYMDFENLHDEDYFRWNEETASAVADALSIPAKGKRSVEERLSVYRAMVSVSRLPEVGLEKIKDHYYSLFSELLARKKGPLGKYIVQNDATFYLEEDSAKKMDGLCHFSSDRDDSPIVNPQEWRPLSRILGDTPEEKVRENLRRVEENKEPPSIVWAQREEELRKLEWSRWLQQVRTILGRAKVEQIEIDDIDAKDRIQRLMQVLNSLEVGETK